MIMTSSVLIGITLTSGTTLTLRNLGLKEKSKSGTASFHSLIAIEVFVGCILFWLALLMFSELKYVLHPNLIFIAIIYYLASITHLVVFELLITHTAFKFLSISEIVTIVLQISIFSFLKYFVNISIASMVLFSFILSYLTVIAVSLFYLKNKFGFLINFGNPIIFLRMTKGNHTLGTVLGIVDRFDRLIIAWFLPIALLGKYAIMSSAISFFRFLPEAIAKLIVSTKSDAWHKLLKAKYVLFGFLALAAIAVFALQLIIESTLGPNWLLPLSISYVFALQELARGMFQLMGNYKITIGESTQIHNAALCLLLITGPSAYLLSRLYGLIGVPLGFFISYVAVLLLMRKKSQSV